MCGTMFGAPDVVCLHQHSNRAFAQPRRGRDVHMARDVHSVAVHGLDRLDADLISTRDTAIVVLNCIVSITVGEAWHSFRLYHGTGRCKPCILQQLA
jgi:hypothetical protein